MISPVVLQMSSVAGLLGIAVLAIVLSRAKNSTAFVYSVTLAVSLVALLGSICWLVADAQNVSDLTLPIGLPWLGAHFRLDALASFFLIVVNLGGAAASLYGLGYGHHDPAPHRVLPFFPAFLAGMNLVVLADDAFSYLLCWEFMSLVSWALVMVHHRETGNAKAGYVYLVMASFGTLALAFGLLAGPAGTYEFAAIRAAQHTPYAATLVLILMLLGAGSKAGLVPLHVWLPLAHPAAPSHVSALMSGVMTKVAIYGFIRVVFDLLGPPTWSASVIVLFLGGITAVMGILAMLLPRVFHVNGGLKINFENRPTHSLRPYAGNARTYSPKQTRQISRSIERFGFNNPALVDDDDQIIAGHGRVEAAKLLNMKTVPTVRLSHLSEAEKRAYILADNRLAEKAGRDNDTLAIELQELVDIGFDVLLTGFEPAEVDIIIEGIGDESEQPENLVPEEPSGPPVSRLGEMLAAGDAHYAGLKNVCIWNKTNGGMGTFYRSKHVMVFVWKNGSAPHVNTSELGQCGRTRTNVWDYDGVNTMRPGRMYELAVQPTR